MKNLKKWGWLFTILVLVLVNWGASVFHSRIDLTNDKRFTLTPATKQLLGSLDEEVEIKVFLKGEFPAAFRRLANSTRETLQEFKEVAGKHIVFSFVNPADKMEGTQVSWADTLTAMGLYPINLKSQLAQGEQQQLVFPIALVKYNDKVDAFRLFNGVQGPGGNEMISHQDINNAEAMMEYQFANSIYKLRETQKPLIAYATGNGEPEDARTYDLVENVLKPNYDLRVINLQTLPFIEDTFKLVLIDKPSIPFSEFEKLKLDQYVMRGGRLLMFIDHLNAEMDSLRIKNEVIAYDRNLGLNDLLFKYGARLNPSLVMDLQSDRLPFDVNGNGQYEFLSWNYFPVFVSKNNHPINKNLGFVSGRFVNSIDTTEVEGVKKTILLSSSQNSRTIAAPALISGKENVNAPEDEKFKQADIPVAVLLEGKFSSMFRNRLSTALNDSLQKYGQEFIPRETSSNKIIVVGDGDMILNEISQNQPLPMGMNSFTMGSQYEYRFANREFLENCLEYLINQSGLSEAKSKNFTLQLLNGKKIKEEESKWQVINILVPVSAVIAFALIFQFIRRRKYQV